MVEATAETMTTRESWRALLLRVLAVLATVCAVIHFAVAGTHFQEYWAFGVFMVVVAWLQLAWAIAVTLRPTAIVLAAGAALNAWVVGVYVVTRTVGDVIGPTPNEAEPVGFGDLLCTVFEALVVAIAVLLVLRSFARPLSRSRMTTATALVAGAAMVLLSVALLDGGPEMGGGPAMGPGMAAGMTAASHSAIPARAPGAIPTRTSHSAVPVGAPAPAIVRAPATLRPAALPAPGTLPE